MTHEWERDAAQFEESQPGDLECPDCLSKNIETIPTEHPFRYGVGVDAVDLKAILPFRKCGDCGLQFLDDEGEDAWQAEVDRYLKTKETK